MKRIHSASFVVVLLGALFCVACSSGSRTVPPSAPDSTSRRSSASTVTAGPLAVAVNAGGQAVSYFSADKYYVGYGGSGTDSNPINVSAPNSAPAAVYASYKTAPNTLDYNVTGLAPNAPYVGYLHFEEPLQGGPGRRVMSVTVGGVVVAASLDIYAAAGGEHIAYVLPFSAVSTSSGTLEILLTTIVNASIISGFEIYSAIPPTPSPSPSPPPTPSPAPTPTTLVAINAGGPAAGYFIADKYWVGYSGTGTDANTVVTTGVANAAPEAVYQSYRTAPNTLTYSITGLVPNAPYTGYLHFEEPLQGGPGRRVESVSVGGVMVATSLDIYAAAGGEHRPYVIPFAANADATGTLQILLTKIVNAAIISGIEVDWIPPAPPTAAPTGEMPKAAAAFADSAGVNVHLTFGGTYYATNFAGTAALLEGAHIHHIRDGAFPGQTGICSEVQTLAANGIHLDVITNPQLSMTNLASYVACAAPAVETIEGPNEYDTSGDPNWASTLDAYEPALFSAVQALGGIAVYAPALTSEADYAAAGSLVQWINDGNMHDYFAGRNPGTVGWGPTDAFGTYGSLAANMGYASQDSGSDPIVSTETGYSDNAVDTYAVPAATQADYIQRTLLEHWNAGVPRTYLYELIDEGNVPFSHYGLADASGNPKPAYTALKNLLAHVADSGSPALSPLSYAISAASTVQHTLLQKSNGSYVLILWDEVPEWDPIALAAIAVTPQPVTLTFAAAPSAVAATTFDANGNVTTTSLTASTSVSLTVNGSPTIVDITR